MVASAISVFEFAAAVRFSASLEQWLGDVLLLPELRIEPVSAGIARLAGDLPNPMSGDPADRIIAATAIALQVKLITADERLQGSPHVTAVW